MTQTVTLTINDVPEPPPVAVDDFFATDEDVSLSASVLDNDQGESLTAAITSSPAYGDASMNPDGTFTYTPHADYHGDDSFWYTITASDNQTATAQVTITVAPVNDPPVAVDLWFNAYEDQQLMIYTFSGNLLLNDSDIDSPTCSPFSAYLQ